MQSQDHYNSPSESAVSPSHAAFDSSLRTHPDVDARDERRRPQLAKSREDGMVIVPSVGPVLPTSALSFDNLSIDPGPADELLTIPEVARRLKISAPTVRRLQQQRNIPFIKVAGCVRFAPSDVAAYLKKRRVESIDLQQHA